MSKNELPPCPCCGEPMRRPSISTTIVCCLSGLCAYQNRDDDHRALCAAVEKGKRLDAAEKRIEDVANLLDEECNLTLSDMLRGQ